MPDSLVTSKVFPITIWTCMNSFGENFNSKIEHIRTICLFKFMKTIGYIHVLSCKVIENDCL